MRASTRSRGHDNDLGNREAAESSRSVPSFRVLDRAPDALGRHGVSRWRTPRGDSASFTAFTRAGSAPTVPASPTPLAPSVYRGRYLVGIHVEVEHVVGARHRVVHARSREQLARRPIVGEPTPRRAPARALDHAAVDLALHEDRIHHAHEDGL